MHTQTNLTVYYINKYNISNLLVLRSLLKMVMTSMNMFLCRRRVSERRLTSRNSSD